MIFDVGVKVAFGAQSSISISNLSKSSTHWTIVDCIKAKGGATWDTIDWILGIIGVPSDLNKVVPAIVPKSVINATTAPGIRAINLAAWFKTNWAPFNPLTKDCNNSAKLPEKLTAEEMVFNLSPTPFNTSAKLFLWKIKASNSSGAGQYFSFSSSNFSSLAKPSVIAWFNWLIPYLLINPSIWGKNKSFNCRNNFTINLPNLCNPWGLASSGAAVFISLGSIVDALIFSF